MFLGFTFGADSIFEEVAGFIRLSAKPSFKLGLLGF